MTRHLLLGALLTVAVLTPGCRAETGSPEAAFRLRGADGVTYTVHTETIEDGAAIGLDGNAAVSVFRVDDGFTGDGRGAVLALALRDAGGAQIGLIGNSGQGRITRSLPEAAPGMVVIETELPADDRVQGFFVVHAGNGGTPRVASAAVTDRSARFDHDGSTAFIGAGIELLAFDWQARRNTTLHIPDVERTLPAEQPWSITVRFAADTDVAAGAPDRRAYTAGRVRLSAPGQSRAMNLVLTAGNRRLYFTNGIVGFAPETIEIEAEPGMGIEHVGLHSDGRVGVDTVYPAIPADLGVINFYNQRAWRHPRFELFAWNVADNVLIFDFADLDIQRDMFGRLGFFVAVAGEAGQVHPEEYYEGRHTYHAHDYRPQDLAPFFTIAEQTGVGLNPREEFLRDVLIDYGIIHRDTEGYREGHGAVLSFSRATWRPLRQRLLRHEAMHGIFYVSERFRQGAFELWERMSPLEQEYWRLFLGNKGRMDGREGYDGYDVERHYLLVNEMQAHVLQLHPQEVNPYFRDFYARRIREVAPQSAHIVDQLLASEPDVFVHTRHALELLLEEVSGVSGGYLMAVYPDDAEILHD
ncbi:MAG: hypothetical protein EA384_04230 [Spirochaetaceae bacterium]|nr:MAG: hypothetical protein EA384_04230 [Spirochaetaceae bacterium]